MVVICGTSAWAWWRTPPIIRDTPIPPESLLELRAQQVGSDIDRMVSFGASKSANEATRLIAGNIYGLLKGVPLPVHVLVDNGTSRKHNGLLYQHGMRRPLPANHLVPLGNGLAVVTPEIALMQMAHTMSFIKVVIYMMEACGLYAVFAPGARALIVVDALQRRGALSREVSPTRANAYCDERGKPLPMVDILGEPLSWAPTYDRKGKMTTLWKRPPVTSVEQLAASYADISGFHGLRHVRRAISLIANGAGSPLEVHWYMLTCLPPRLGGEGWPKPLLNCRKEFPRDVQALAGMPYCICDEYWPEKHGVVEVNGFAYHADEQGFYVASSRNPALEAMGIKVVEVNYDQMAHLEKLDLMLGVCAKRIGFPLRKRTTEFLLRRDALHRELFRG